MNTLKIDVTSLEIGTDDVLLNTYANNRYFEYNESFTSSVILPKYTDYRTITFSEVTSPFMLVLVADNAINVKLNGNEITNTRFLVFNSNIDSLQVSNPSREEESNVKVYIWGEQ